MSGPNFLQRRLRGDDGSLVIEAAIVMPILIVFVLGIFEVGMMTYNNTALTSALRLSARTVANAASDQIPQADYFAIDQFKSETARLKRMTPVRFVVYETDSTGTLNLTTGANNCKTAAQPGITGICNVYTAARISSITTGNFQSVAPPPLVACDTSKWDYQYCPTDGDRGNSLVAASGPDYIGVYAEMQYTLVTSLFPGGTRTISDYVVMRAEPA